MSRTAPARDLVVAVIAAFRPDAVLQEHVRALAAQPLHALVVVDDGSGDGWADVFAGIAAAHPGRVHVVRLDRNSGIAAALNRGAAEAVALGATAVLTLDQDSRPADDYVANAVAAMRRLRRGGRPFAAIAAGVQSGSPVRPAVLADRGQRLTPTLEAIQSGLVIPTEVLDRVGAFDESLFIDCVDTDFVLRASRAGLPTYLARDCALAHPLGSTLETKHVVTRSGARGFAFHPAWRRYYISRNRAVMLRRHGVHAPRWAAQNLLGETVQLARSLVFGSGRLRQTGAVALGVLDAARGRSGRLGRRAAVVLGAPR